MDSRARASPTLFTDPSGTQALEALGRRVLGWLGLEPRDLDPLGLISARRPMDPVQMAPRADPLRDRALREEAARQRLPTIERLQRMPAANPTPREFLETKITNFVQ